MKKKQNVQIHRILCRNFQSCNYTHSRKKEKNKHLYYILTKKKNGKSKSQTFQHHTCKAQSLLLTQRNQDRACNKVLNFDKFRIQSTFKMYICVCIGTNLPYLSHSTANSRIQYHHLLHYQLELLLHLGRFFAASPLSRS